MPPQNDFPLPANLPRPEDDGGADHLVGMAMPKIFLRSTSGRMVDLSNLPTPRTVIYFYPRTGVPGVPVPEEWNLTPGARGCTPQTCGFRDHFEEFVRLKATVFGASTQTTEYQRELAERLHLPFEILSDEKFDLCNALRLPTFEFEGVKLVKRLTLVIRDGRIEHVFYPVFPPDQSAAQLGRWLSENPISK
ncbi:MAG TPA: peroxiredoxin [Candidatus Acidoferrum sp.]|nr:peroxiredoxin [Candidatus Acidoferrum sp.]